MPAIYFLPGYLGSELVLASGTTVGGSKIWVNYLALGAGSFIQLKLDATGKLPDPQFGAAMLPGGPLNDYFGACLQALATYFNPLGWSIYAQGYDWRLDVRTTGQQLAHRIMSREQPSDPCTIVGHSMGGLVARAAWYYLGLAGAQNLVRRIVTIATPHWGTYQIFHLMTGQEPTLQTLAQFSSYIWGLNINGPILPGETALNTAQRVVNSWPSTYQLLPSLNDPFANIDPNRSQLFAASNYPSNNGVNTALLFDALTTWSQFLANPATQPPPNVLICVIGRSSGSVDTALGNFNTSGQFIKASKWPEDGDGVVPNHSAFIASAGTTWNVKAGHSIISTTAALSGLLPELIVCKNLAPAAPNTPTLLDLVQGLIGPLFLTDEVVADQPFQSIKPLLVPPTVVGPPDIGLPPFPSKARIAATGVPQVIDHDC